MSEQVLVSDYVASFLASRRVPAVFEMSGGMIARLLDSLYRLGETRVVSMHHEQSAAFAAGAAGAITGIPAVALATSGPGATNLLTGIGASFFDSQPAVFITGQVNRSELKGDRPIRQLGFQETDIVAMVGPISKAAWRVYTPEEVPERLAAAFELAVAGRPGPVVLDIPMDVFGSRVDAALPARRQEPAAPVDQAAVDELLEALERAERPLILAGGGVRTSGAVPVLRELLGQIAIPLVSSLHGIDTLPFDHPQHYGMIGSYGNRWANGAIGHADLLLVLGSRLDIRQTGADTAFFGDRTIFHVDVEPGEINHRVTGCRAVVGDARAFLEALAARGHAPLAWPGWQDELDAERRRWPDTTEVGDVPGINPNVLMHELSAASAVAGNFVADVGQHQMWAAQSLELSSDQRFVTSGGMGAMGSGLPLAIGVGVVDPRPVVLIAGDGSFQTNIQELETVVRNRLPIKMVIVNNHCHGMVRQFQESYFDGRYPSTLLGYSAPSFTAVAAAYGIAARSVDDPADVEDALHDLWSDPSSPGLLEVVIDTYVNAYPKLAFGKPITEMEPFSKPIAMEGT
jgi:acetolactate synthase I/II/III large subunit